MKTIKLTLLLFLLPLSLLDASPINNKNFGNVRVDEVTSIYDGDTFKVNIAGYPNII